MNVIDNFAEGDIHDRINMIATAFSAITTIARDIQSNQREDVRSVAVLLYSGTSSLVMPGCYNGFSNIAIPRTAQG